MLYRFKVSNESQIRSVFVKVPHRNSKNNQNNGSAYEKPLLFPKTELREMHRLQYSALKSIYEYFTGLGMKHLGAIRVLDYLPQFQAVFTEESSDTSLRDLFLRDSRFRSPFKQGKLSVSFQNTGIWLRMYHRMPKHKDVKVRHQHRDDFAEAISTLADYLVKTLGDEPFFKETASMIIHKGQEVLPESLPLGLGHGDYAMRNILIGPNARVTVLDTFAKWRTPIYEDIGYFLNGLKISYPQIISQGLAFNTAQLAAYERAFLNGYFGEEPIPHPAIKLYEAFALLDKWSSSIALIHQQTVPIKTLGKVKITLLNRYFKRSAKSLLREISES